MLRTLFCIALTFLMFLVQGPHSGVARANGSPVIGNLSNILGDVEKRTEFPIFADTQEQAEAYQQILTAMNKPDQVLRPTDYGQADVSDARKKIAQNNGGVLPEIHSKILDELEAWLGMKQEVIGFFNDTADFLQDLERRQLLAINTVYDRLSIKYPPNAKADRTLGDVYLGMLFDVGGLASNLGSVVSSPVGPAIGTVTQIISMCITAANDIQTLSETATVQDDTPMSLSKINLKEQVEDRFVAMVQRNREIRDLVLNDFGFLQAFSRVQVITAKDKRLLTEEYVRGFERQLWLTVLPNDTEWKTILTQPKLLKGFSCDGQLSDCVNDTARKFVQKALSTDTSTYAVALAEIKFCQTRGSGNQPHLCGAREWSKIYPFALRLGREDRDGNVNALDGSTMARMFSSGVTRHDLRRILNLDVDSKSFRSANRGLSGLSGTMASGTRVKSYGEVEAFYDMLHGDFLKFADLAEIHTHFTSKHPPALATYRPAGEPDEKLFLAFHAPPPRKLIDKDRNPIAWETVMLSNSTDGKQWSSPQDIYGLYFQAPADVPVTGPALLSSGERLLVAYGSWQSGSPVFGRYLDMTDFSYLKEDYELRKAKLDLERRAWLEENGRDPDDPKVTVLGWPKARQYSHVMISLQRANFDALRSWPIEPTEEIIVLAPEDSDSIIERFRPHRKSFAQTSAQTDVPVALTETLFALGGMKDTNNAAIMVFKKAGTNEIYWRQGSYDEFYGVGNTPVAHSPNAPAVTAYPKEWALIAYRTDPKRTGEAAAIKIASLLDVFQGKSEASHSLVNLPDGVVPQSGPAMIYDHDRNQLYLSFADKKGSLRLLRKAPGESTWTHLREITNETMERPALTIFRDRLWIAARRSQGQIIIAPLLDLNGPKLAFVSAEDPRYDEYSGKFADLFEDNWQRTDKSHDSEYGIVGWSMGPPPANLSGEDIGERIWQTTTSRDYPKSNRAAVALRTPPIMLEPRAAGSGKAAAPMLRFRHWMRTSTAEGLKGGSVSVVLTGGSDEPVDLGRLELTVPDHERASGRRAAEIVDTSNGGWQQVSAELPARLYGQTFSLLFNFEDPGDAISENGWAIGEISIEVP